MNAESLIMQSVIITCMGMGIVFAFLVILIGAVKILGCLVQAMEKYFPQATPRQAAAGADNALVAVAIAAARRFQGK